MERERPVRNGRELGGQIADSGMPERERRPLTDGEIDHDRIGKTRGKRPALALQSQTRLRRAETVVGNGRRHREVRESRKGGGVLRHIQSLATTGADQCFARSRDGAQQAHRFFDARLSHFMEQSQSYPMIPEGLQRQVKDGWRQAFAVKQRDGCQTRARQVQAQALQCAGLHANKPWHTDLNILHISCLTISLHRENGRNASPCCRSASARNPRAKRNSGRTSKAGCRSGRPSPAKATVSVSCRACRTTADLSMPTDAE